jgi:hypothetical protein
MLEYDGSGVVGHAGWSGEFAVARSGTLRVFAGEALDPAPS